MVCIVLDGVSGHNLLQSNSAMQDTQKQVLPALPAASDPLSIEIYNEHHIDSCVRSLLTSHLTAHLDVNNKIKALVLGGRCGIVPEILLPFCSHMDIVEQMPFANLLRLRFNEGKEIDYFFGREGFLGCRHVYPAPSLTGQDVRIILAENLKAEGHKHYDLIVLQNPIITGQANLIQQLLSTDHSLLLTLMVPGKIADPRLFSFFARFEKHVIPALYSPLAYQRLQNRRYITARREEILYLEIYTFKRNEGQPISQTELIQLLAEEQGEHSEANVKPINPYEGKTMVEAYLGFHYGPSFFGIQNFPEACARVSIQEAKKRGLTGRALDLGCAVGRSTVEMASHFSQVVGLDYSNAFIEAAQKVLLEQYEQLASKVRFVVGDACNLDTTLGKFSVIFGGNLIDRLPDPAAFLLSVSDFLQPNGLLILTSPYSWLAQYTSPDKWVGGIIENGKQVSTPEGLQRILSPLGFISCKESENLRFVIKMNDWVYQYTLANATFWLKQ